FGLAVYFRPTHEIEYYKPPDEVPQPRSARRTSLFPSPEVLDQNQITFQSHTVNQEYLPGRQRYCDGRCRVNRVYGKRKPVDDARLPTRWLLLDYCRATNSGAKI